MHPDGSPGPAPETGRALDLPDPAATDALGARLAPALAPGDVVLLEGPLGAGKSALARAVIRARLAAAGAPEEDIPSPTFTLVQTYEAGGTEIWHCDLYRLSGPEEAAELGLEEAFARAICLVEWPERLGRHLPARHLRIRLEEAGAGRRAILSPSGNWPGLPA